MKNVSKRLLNAPYIWTGDSAVTLPRSDDNENQVMWMFSRDLISTVPVIFKLKDAAIVMFALARLRGGIITDKRPRR